MVVFHFIKEAYGVIKANAKQLEGHIDHQYKQGVYLEATELPMYLLSKREEGEVAKRFFEIKQEKVVDLKARDVGIAV